MENTVTKLYKKMYDLDGEITKISKFLTENPMFRKDEYNDQIEHYFKQLGDIVTTARTFISVGSETGNTAEHVQIKTGQPFTVEPSEMDYFYRVGLRAERVKEKAHDIKQNELFFVVNGEIETPNIKTAHATADHINAELSNGEKCKVEQWQTLIINYNTGALIDVYNIEKSLLTSTNSALYCVYCEIARFIRDFNVLHISEKADGKIYKCSNDIIINVISKPVIEIDY